MRGKYRQHRYYLDIKRMESDRKSMMLDMRQYGQYLGLSTPENRSKIKNKGYIGLNRLKKYVLFRQFLKQDKITQ